MLNTYNINLKTMDKFPTFEVIKVDQRGKKLKKKIIPESKININAQVAIFSSKLNQC